MTAVLKVLPRPLQESVTDILEESKGKGFETVIVLGIKDGSTHIRASRWHSRLEVMGALEYAKHHVWES